MSTTLADTVLANPTGASIPENEPTLAYITIELAERAAQDESAMEALVVYCERLLDAGHHDWVVHCLWWAAAANDALLVHSAFLRAVQGPIGDCLVQHGPDVGLVELEKILHKEQEV